MHSLHKHIKKPFSTKRSIAWVKKHRRILMVSGIVSLSIVSMAVFALRTQLPAHAHTTDAAVSVSQSLHVSLNQKLANLDTNSISITPKIEGTWSYKKGSLTRNDELVFTPKSYFTVATQYRIAFPRASRVLFGSTTLKDITFKTESAPGLTKQSLASFVPTSTLPADHTFTATLSSPNRNLRSLELRTTPQINLAMKSQNDTSFTWQSDRLLPQGQKVTVELYDKKNNVSLLKKEVVIASEPKIASTSSLARLTAKDPIRLIFDQPIDAKKSAEAAFDTPGKGSWKSATEYEFVPENLAPGKTYNYSFKKGLRSTSGGISTSDYSGTFSTIGAVAVTASSPKAKNMSQAKQVISFTFDQPVDRESAQKRVSVSSGTIAGFAWSGNTMNVTAVDLGYQRTVTASVAPGVVNAGFGLLSTQVFSTAFTTETRSVKLNVPYYRQQHSATCTAAALRMTLSFRGVGSDEIGLVNAMGYAPRDKDTSTNPPTWDDPQSMFVGSIDGSIVKGTGAGPDAPPTAKAARAYGRSAQDYTGISAGWIAQQLYNGNPVIMFGAFKSTGMTSWRTPSGGTATMNLTGHVYVVTGVVGEPSSPIGFYVHDPLGGTNQYWSVSSLSANIARDPYKQAVVVY